MNTEIGIFKQIYLKPGIHVRSLSRELKIGIPSIKYGLKKLLSKNLIKPEKEGRNLKFYINYKNNLVVPYLYNVEYSRLLELPNNVQNALFHFLDYCRHKAPVLTLIFGSYASGDYTKGSDLDVLIVYNEIDEKLSKWIEGIAKIFSNNHNVDFQPVYLTWEEFHRKLYNRTDDLMNRVREDKILVSGIEWWVLLEGKCHWKERT
jgi:predicted nucleotidyltransferase